MYIRRSQLTLRTLIDGLNESTFVTYRHSPYLTQADTVPTIIVKLFNQDMHRRNEDTSLVIMTLYAWSQMQ